MSYLLDKKNKKRKIIQITFGIIIFLIFFYFRSPVFNALSYATNKIFYPVLHSSNFVSQKVKSISVFFRSKNYLNLENADLQSRLTHNENLMVNYNAVVAENNQLKEILGRKGERSLILGAILSKPNKSSYDTLVVDVGVDEGIKVGDKVFASGVIPIGRVVDVYTRSSKVVLFSNSRESTEVVVGSSGVFMEMIGRGGGNFEILAPRDFVLEKGAEVVLPGINPYVVAVVDSVISDVRDSSQKVLLITPVNINELKFVELEK
ncbi:MAG: rod shape-determining protein MreC [Patescibacteria group bacterium]